VPGGFPAGLPLWPGGHRVGLPTSARLENRAEGGGPRQIPRSRCQRGAGLRDFLSQHYADITKAHHTPNQRVKVSRCRQSMRLRNMPEIFIGLRSLAITSAMQCEATIDYEQRRRTSLRLASPALWPHWSLAPDYRAANTSLIGILLLSVATPVISDTCLAQRRGSIRGQGDVS
jgi:hypothetical protein